VTHLRGCVGGEKTKSQKQNKGKGTEKGGKLKWEKRRNEVQRDFGKKQVHKIDGAAHDTLGCKRGNF